jgi:hypothetical protein
MAWDGVSRRILMSRLVRSQYPNVPDSETYAFAGRKWSKLPAGQPIPTIGYQFGLLVYDSDRNREVFAYGPDMGQPSRGTWEWDGKTWTQIPTAHPVPTLFNPSAAYSPELHAVVVIGPCQMNQVKTLLLFDGTDWRSVSTPRSPGCDAQLAYSQMRHAIVALSTAQEEHVYSSQYHYQTWTFDGRDWSPTEHSGTASPARSMIPHVGNGMDSHSPSAAFDVKRDTWVLFGGMERCLGVNQFCYKADTWTGDYASWTRRTSSNSPIARSGPGMTWDPDLNAIVLFGGFVGQCCQGIIGLSDTWSWDGSKWRQLAGPVYHGAPTAAVPTA